MTTKEQVRIVLLENQLAEAKRTFSAQERERLDLMSRRVHQLEAENQDLRRGVERMLRKLGKEAMRYEAAAKRSSVKRKTGG